MAEKEHMERTEYEAWEEEKIRTDADVELLKQIKEELTESLSQEQIDRRYKAIQAEKRKKKMLLLR